MVLVGKKFGQNHSFISSIKSSYEKVIDVILGNVFDVLARLNPTSISLNLVNIGASILVSPTELAVPVVKLVALSNLYLGVIVCPVVVVSNVIIRFKASFSLLGLPPSKIRDSRDPVADALSPRAILSSPNAI